MLKGFEQIFDKHDWKAVSASIYAKTSKDVERALSTSSRDIEDFKALISPAAEQYLEQMAQQSHALTKKHFGNNIQMYIPLYLSNECQNICTYCGFSLDVKLKRKTLTDAEIHAEAKLIKRLGYDHVLVVTGEANKTVGMPYFLNAIKILKQYFAHISLEVQPLEQEDYFKLKQAGVQAILVYQETYHKEDYKKHHPKGRKSNFAYRLDTPDRIGRSGMHKIGLGVLIGLEDWRVDSFFTALHMQYLEKKYWKSRYAISFPRLRPCASGIPLKSVISDRQLTQLICAYRLLNPMVELSMSTRESQKFRDNIIKLGITSISAESSTEPGGYSTPKKSLEQFETDDKRNTKSFVQVIKDQGYNVVFKDWDKSLQ